MGSPKHQHFIPRSYLKYFGEKRDDLFWVDTFMRGKGNTVQTLSTKSVCVQKNLYTFPVDTEGDRFALEKFYAVEVDAIYPEVYDMLINPNISVIGEDDKRKILNTILSLLFRTPRFLNYKTEKIDEVLDRVAAEVGDPEQEVTVGFDGKQLTFKRMDIEEVREEKMKELKQDFLISHFADWQEFVKFKMQCGIEIITVSDDVPVITSDSPVVVMDMNGKLNLNDIFHSHNIIEFPIDRNTYVIIFPNSVSEREDRLRLTRSNRDKYFTAGVNNSIGKYSYNRIIGYPGDLKINSQIQRELGEWNEANVGAFGSLVQKTGMAVELMKVIKRNGTSICQEVADTVRKIRKTGQMDDDETFKKLILALARNGYLTV
jgi:hypothetical protein